MRYILEVNEPGETEVAAAIFESDVPFGAIAVGDLLDTSVWKDSTKPGVLLRVVNINHIIWDFGKGLAHKICIFTKAEENDRHTKLARQQ